MKKSLFIGLVFLVCSSLFGMETKKITKKHFNKTVKQYFSGALSLWVKHTNLTQDNNLYTALKTIQIDSLLKDEKIIEKINFMLKFMKRDDRYYEAQALLKQNMDPLSIFSYRKKMLILGLQILIVYAGIRPPEIIKPNSQSTGIVSDEHAFLEVNYSWNQEKLPELKAALLLLSLELSKAEK